MIVFPYQHYPIKNFSSTWLMWGNRYTRDYNYRVMVAYVAYALILSWFISPLPYRNTGCLMLSDSDLLFNVSSQYTAS